VVLRVHGAYILDLLDEVSWFVRSSINNSNNNNKSFAVKAKFDNVVSVNIQVSIDIHALKFTPFGRVRCLMGIRAELLSFFCVVCQCKTICRTLNTVK
jgi:hypothetical protein